MRVLLFGATGMIGQGVLRECLLDSEVASVTSIGRASTGVVHPKLREIVHADLYDYDGLALEGFDACLFLLGVCSAGMSEQQYRRITYDLTLAAANALVQRNPQLTFIYVSGEGTDANGRAMWARVKGETENALLRLPFRRAFMFRPAFIQPMHGEKSRTRVYRILYLFVAPFVPLLRRLIPQYFTTTEQIARAMLRVAKHGGEKQILHTADINRI
ncbi:MAG: epimerase [Thermoanaerobaculia bacterium]